MRVISVGLALVVAATAMVTAGAARAQVLAVEIGQAGQIEAADPDPPALPPAGSNLVGSSQQSPKRYIHIGSDIDAKFCTLFGFEFRAPNLSPPLEVPVTIVLDHPVWNRPDGRSGTQERYTNMLRSTWSYSGYHLEESWTLVPGTWKFTVMLGNSVLATQSFELTVAPGQTFPQAGCGAPVS
jgi:hypothetical protein